MDAERLARFARLDPKILRPIVHRTIAEQEVSLSFALLVCDDPCSDDCVSPLAFLRLWFQGTIIDLNEQLAAFRRLSCRGIDSLNNKDPSLIFGEPALKLTSAGGAVECGPVPG